MSTDGELEVTGAVVGVRGDLFAPTCPTRQLLDRVGTKWTSMIIKILAEAHPDEIRFAQLRRQAPGISSKVLSTTLRGLVDDGIVSRRVENSVPPRVHYSVTELGRSLDGPLAALRDWAETHMPEITSHRARVAHSLTPGEGC